MYSEVEARDRQRNHGGMCSRIPQSGLHSLERQSTRQLRPGPSRLDRPASVRSSSWNPITHRRFRLHRFPPKRIRERCSPGSFDEQFTISNPPERAVVVQSSGNDPGSVGEFVCTFYPRALTGLGSQLRCAGRVPAGQRDRYNFLDRSALLAGTMRFVDPGGNFRYWNALWGKIPGSRGPVVDEHR